jgi:myosin heavy subunit
MFCSTRCLKFRSHLFHIDQSKHAKRPPSIAQQFRHSVDTLIKKLMSCRAHYVRCIKPNDVKLPGKFSKEMILNQIQYLGLKENVMVRQLGFVYSAPYAQFLHHYRCISKETFPKFTEAYAKESKIKDACAHLVAITVISISISADNSTDTRSECIAIGSHQNLHQESRNHPCTGRITREKIK